MTKKIKDQEDQEKTGLQILYKAETENDIADLCGALLYVRDISDMAKATMLQPGSHYYTLKGAFDLIQILIEPVMSFLIDGDAEAYRKAYYNKKRK